MFHSNFHINYMILLQIREPFDNTVISVKFILIIHKASFISVVGSVSSHNGQIKISLRNVTPIP